MSRRLYSDMHNPTLHLVKIMRARSSFLTISQHLSRQRVVPSLSNPRVLGAVSGSRSLSLTTRKMESNGVIRSQNTTTNSNLNISKLVDDAAIRNKYRPFLLDERVATSDWISKLELDVVEDMVRADLAGKNGERLRVLVLYGSLRSRCVMLFYINDVFAATLTHDSSYSKLLAFECARILHRLGCDVRVFDPKDLPVKDDTQQDHPKVQELRELSIWSNGHVWVSPEQHGNLVCTTSSSQSMSVLSQADTNHNQTAVFKNQIDWIPLSTGSVRPTQGRTLAIAQVSGGSQSFNTVNSLRMLGRWMRLFAIPNQSSIPQAYTQFTDAHDPQSKDLDALLDAEGGSRLMPSSNRDRVVDCMEEFVKYTILMRPHFDLFADRYSERTERKRKEEKAAAQ